MLILDKPVEPVVGELETGYELALAELERGVHAALETYSNVHRGTGHNSMVSTALFEQARNVVLEYLGLDHDRYVVVFGTPRSAKIFKAQLRPGSYRFLSSQDFGLPVGIRALIVERNTLPKGVPFQTGGEVVKSVSANSVIWADPPHKFEAGTPSITNVIAFARALKVIQHFGNSGFEKQSDGAAAVVVMSREKAEELGCGILATIGAQASYGIDMKYVLVAPIWAIPCPIKPAPTIAITPMSSTFIFEISFSESVFVPYRRI